VRKANSEYKTAFISEAGSEAVNHDYFGFVELENFACYVIADGLYPWHDVESARLAIEAVVQAFEERPSIRKGALRRYLRTANNRLVRSRRKRYKLVASLTIVVTNYEVMRYGTTGNTRMTMYRGDTVFTRSKDMSLAQRIATREDEPIDKLARHEERNNLLTYLGQDSGFSPYISRKIALKETDVITLYTRGIWENVDDGELLDIIGESGNDPQEAVHIMEEMLLSRQPKNLENYTFAAIYVEKVFTDPNRKKRIKKIIKISVIVFIILLIVGIVLFFWFRRRNNLHRDMNEYIDTMRINITYNNYDRALSNAESAHALARRLRGRGRDYLVSLDSYILFIDMVINADRLLDSRRFQDAQDAYLQALNNMPNGNAGYDHIRGGIESTEQFILFFASMELADRLVTLRNYTVALYLYNEARSLASNLFFSEGRQSALDAIADVHIRMTRASEAQAAIDEAIRLEAQQIATDHAAAVLAATELLAQGNIHRLAGDYISALIFYQMSRQAHQALNDDNGVLVTTSLIELTERRMAERSSDEYLASSYVEIGFAFFEMARYPDALRYFTRALQMYEQLGILERASQMSLQIELTRLADERANERLMENLRREQEEIAARRAEEERLAREAEEAALLEAMEQYGEDE